MDVLTGSWIKSGHNSRTQKVLKVQKKKLPAFNGP